MTLTAASIPVDRTAARVVRPGVRFDYKSSPKVLDGPPPPTGRQPPMRANTPHYLDLSGREFLHATVIRLYDYDRRKEHKKRFKWVCRCRCGNYFITSGHAVKRAREDNAVRCGQCWETFNLLRGKPRYDTRNTPH